MKAPKSPEIRAFYRLEAAFDRALASFRVINFDAWAKRLRDAEELAYPGAFARQQAHLERAHFRQQREIAENVAAFDDIND